MKNLDMIKQQRDEFKQKLGDAFAANDPQQLAQALDGFAEAMQDIVIREAQGMAQAQDVSILAQRGIRQLTGEERGYYEQLALAMRSDSPQQSLANMDVTLPKTVVDSIFEDLERAHPLLEAITFQNTTAVTEWLINEHEAQLAHWGKIDAAITKEITSSFGKITTTLAKLSAFLPVSKGMLDLGPEWLDRYTRAVLLEASAVGLEEGMINGTGKDMPIGMNRQVGEGVVVTGGVYPMKELVPLQDFTPATYGAFIAQHLAATAKGNPRVVEEVLMIVNPWDYLRRIMPATTILTPDGTFVRDVLPFPTKIVQSTRVPQGEAIFGIAKRYFAGVGMSKEGRIEYSDEYRFLEDERMYLIKLYANGRPMDNCSFVRTDISKVTPAAYHVFVEGMTQEAADSEPANVKLASLSMGSCTLSPAFDPDTSVYTASTTNNSNGVNVTAQDNGATVEVKVNGAALTSGATATWNVGENVVEITVTKDAATRNYIVMVTKA